LGVTCNSKFMHSHTRTSPMTGLVVKFYQISSRISCIYKIFRLTDRHKQHLIAVAILWWVINIYTLFHISFRFFDKCKILYHTFTLKMFNIHESLITCVPASPNSCFALVPFSSVSSPYVSPRSV